VAFCFATPLIPDAMDCDNDFAHEISPIRLGEIKQFVILRQNDSVFVWQLSAANRTFSGPAGIDRALRAVSGHLLLQGYNIYNAMIFMGSL